MTKITSLFAMSAAFLALTLVTAGRTPASIGKPVAPSEASSVTGAAAAATCQNILNGTQPACGRRCRKGGTGSATEDKFAAGKSVTPATSAHDCGCGGSLQVGVSCKGYE